jgi:predicted  nucleic acid-binding Zn-ribbon protein
VIIDESELKDLRDEIERLQHEIDQLHEGIADANELLGHEGCKPDDLRDALAGLERVLDGKDLGDELEGITARVQSLVRDYTSGTSGALKIVSKGPASPS